MSKSMNIVYINIGLKITVKGAYAFEDGSQKIVFISYLKISQYRKEFGHKQISLQATIFKC